jgi:hypothetical protein
LFLLLRLEFGVVLSSEVDKCLKDWISNSGGLFYLLFLNISLFYFIKFPNFEVPHIILGTDSHVLDVKGNVLNVLEEVFYV